MLPDRRRTYKIYVGSASLHESLSIAKSTNFQVDIQLSGEKDLHQTIIQQTPCWNEEFRIIGDLLSIISFKIKQSGAENDTPSLCVGCVEIPLGTLLKICADDEAAVLKITLIMVKPKQQNTSFLTVKLSTLNDPTELNNLALEQIESFERLGDFLDVENAIANLREAIELTEDGHPDKPDYLMNLGISQQTRFEQLGELVAIESAIENLREAVELTDDGNPDKPACLVNLGNSQHLRFQHFGELSDIESAISNLREAIELTDNGHPNKPGRLSNLGACQKTRFKHLGELSDLDSAIANLRKAVEITDDGHPAKTACLVNLGSSQQLRFECLGELPDLESAIANLREAIQFTNDEYVNKPIYLTNLGISQGTRFQRLGGLSDLESSIANLAEAAELTEDGHPHKPSRLMNLGVSQHTRFERLGELVDIDGAIANLRAAIELVDEGHPNKPACLSNLGLSQQTRFERLGEWHDLECAIKNLQEAVELTDDGHPDRPVRLSNLGISQQTRFQRLGEFSDLESAIANLLEAVKLTDDSHPEKPVRLSNLGIIQQSRFELLGDLSDLESAIANHTKAVEITHDAHPYKPNCLLNLALSQEIRFEHLGEFSDRMAAVASLKLAAQSPVAYPRQALAAAKHWANLSQDLSSALDAYRTAIEMLPQVAWLGLDTPSRQRWLSEEIPESLGCLAATCAIQLGRFEEAIELLDLARSVFWQQASSVRSDLRDLREEHPGLAKQLETVSQALDVNSFSDSFVASDIKLYKHRVQEHRRLVLERESLIERVRQLPGFEFFLKPIPFRYLRSIAAGQVVIINCSQNGADALIFDDTHPVQHVPLPDVDLETLAEYSRDILLKRPSAATVLQQKGYVKQYLRPALRMVGEDIIGPIFNALHIPLQGTAIHPPSRRILWYPTGHLTFIPIHAAGPSGKGFDVSRLVISSYVTTLGSLFHAQMRYRERATEPPKLLAISQPETLGQSPLPQATVEIEKVIQVLSAAGWLPEDQECLLSADATVNSVFNALDRCSWAHFACHGLQDPIKGMNSAFALHDGNLDLARLASKRLSAAQFAFLSVCQAASGLRDLPGEAMHIAAGMQFAGFLSVIATMWNICDDDGPRVAEHIYRYLLRNGLERVDISESAAALNHAILRLREDSSVTVDRWAPFIHFGL